MERPSNPEHDHWMQKITLALRSFRSAQLHAAERTPSRPASPIDGASDSGRDAAH
ncbi:MAG: hypothetical protein ABSE49_26060 [Polyangiaceae bacterium]|jgi:hypothetical protein